jgi:hypothetical protein
VEHSRNPATAKFAALFRPVPAASLGVFRITLGLAMLYEFSNMRPYVLHELSYSRFFMTYELFHWVRLVPRPWIDIVFAAGSIASVAVVLGLFTRTAKLVVFILYGYIFLLDKGHYNNHYYLFCLLNFLSLFLASERWGSIDRRRNREMSDFAPVWNIYVLRAQIIVVYVFGGIVKLNADWLAGFPMRIWLPQRSHWTWIGPWLATDEVAYFFSYTGVVFDLLIGFLLLSRRTRIWTIPVLLFFHVSNHFIWNIGAFPWFMIAATGLFFDPDWPERAIERLFGEQGARRRSREARLAAAQARFEPPARASATTALLAAWMAFQCLFPLRHLLQPGDPAWNGAGTFFAWHMMLDDRYDAVRVRIEVPEEGPIGQLNLQEYVNSRQFQKIGWDPTVFVRLARFVENEMKENGGIEDAAVYVDAYKSLNGRPYRRLIDPTVDLTQVETAWFGAREYVLPLEPGLKPSATPPPPPADSDSVRVP